MKLLTGAAAGAALLATSTLAFAAVDTGTITNIDWGIGTITLDNGDIYVIPYGLRAQVTLEVGQKVKVTYQDLIASDVAPVS